MRSSRHARAIARSAVACAAAVLFGGLMLGSQCAMPPGGDTDGDASDVPATKPKVYVWTSMGKMVFELYPPQATQSVESFLKLVDQDHYYDNTLVSDVSPQKTGFLGGEYTIDLEAKDDQPFYNESNNGLANTRGRVALYGPTDEQSGRPRFLVNTAANAELDYVISGDKVNYTVIGQIVQGLEVADKIVALSTTSATADDGTSLSRLPKTEDGDRVRIIKMSTDPTEPVNTTPIANAGEDQEVEPDETVTLDSSASADADGDPIRRNWELTQESQDLLDTNDLSVSLSSATAEKPTFTAPRPTSPIQITFDLTITDDRGASSTDSVVITLSDNKTPVAVAGEDKTVAPGDSVTLDGSGSSDSDLTGDLVYHWTLSTASQQLLTDQSLPALADGTSKTYTFTAPAVTQPTELIFTLSVTDDRSATGTETAAVRILPVSFAAPAGYATSAGGAGAGPSSVVAADFDGDDNIDLAIANANLGNVTVLLNHGDGTFDAPVAYAVGDNPISLVTRDFNQDSHADLAVACDDLTASQRLWVLLNDGAGGFANSSHYALGSGPASLASGDFDGKNGPDLAAVNVADGKLSVRVNDGSGEFNEGNTALAIDIKDTNNSVLATTGPTVLAADTVSSDSRADLVVAYANAGNPRSAVFLGDSTSGQFTFGSYFTMPAPPADVRAALLKDLDGTNKAEIVFALAGLNVVAVRRNSGDGKFGVEGQYETGANPSALAAADLNQDTYADLIIANQDDNNISLLMNKKTGTFKNRLNLALDVGDVAPSGVTTGDFDGDDISDIAVVSNTSGTLTVLLNRTNPALAPVDAKGFTTTSTWLKYKDIVVGTGDEVDEDSTVVARYTGRLDDENGKIFDTTVGTTDETDGREFSLDSVIKGWKEGLGKYGMKVGGKRQLIIPAVLGYGTSGSSPKIPANATLWFEVEVLEIK